MKYSTIFVTALTVLMVPLALHAADTSFVPLTQVPAFNDVASNSNLSGFFNSLYKYCIGIAAILAVLQLIRAGIMYMSPDSIGEKSEARNLIGLSLFGLLLVLSPVIVFSLIDPRILNLQLNLAPLHSNAPSAPVAPNQPVNGALSTGEEFPDGSTVSCVFPGGQIGNKIGTVLAHISSTVSGNLLRIQFNDPSLGTQNGTVSPVAPGDCHGYQADPAATSALSQYHVNDMVYCPLDPPKYNYGQVVSIDATRGWLNVHFHTTTTSFGANSCFKSGSTQEREVCGTAPNCTSICEITTGASGDLCEPTQ